MPFFLRKTAKMQKKVAVTPGRKMKPGTATFYCLRFDATRIRSRISSHEDEAEQATPADIILASNARHRTQGQNKLSLEHLTKDDRRRSERPGIIRGRGCVRRKAPPTPAAHTVPTALLPGVFDFVTRI